MRYRFVVLIVLLLGVAACSEEPTQSQQSPTATPNLPGSATTAEQPQVQSSDAYPIDFCVVSGEKLGSMGPAVEVEVQGRTVKLCCNSCKRKLLADPARYLAKLDAGANMTAPSGSHDIHQH